MELRIVVDRIHNSVDFVDGDGRLLRDGQCDRYSEIGGRTNDRLPTFLPYEPVAEVRRLARYIVLAVENHRNDGTLTSRGRNNPCLGSVDVPSNPSTPRLTLLQQAPTPSVSWTAHARPSSRSSRCHGPMPSGARRRPFAGSQPVGPSASRGRRDLRLRHMLREHDLRLVWCDYDFKDFCLVGAAEDGGFVAFLLTRYDQNP